MTKDQIILALTSKVAVGAFSAIAGLAAGGAGGYYLAKKKLVLEFEDVLAVEIAETKEFYEQYYARLNKGTGYETPMAAAETLGVEVEVEETRTSALLTGAVEAMVNYAGVTATQDTDDGVVHAKPFEHIVRRSASVDDVVEEEEVVRSNVFVDGTPMEDLTEDELFDADTQVAIAAASAPYVISFEDFMQAEPGYEQPGLTYFSEDDILLDDKEEVIEDVEKVIGEEALLRFGFRSKNNDIVYVRNPVLELDFEVTRSRNSYASDVLGLKHSSDRRPMRRFRPGDDE